MLDAVVKLRDSGAYLCHVCRKKLEMISSLEDKLAALQKELESLKDEINRKMTQLTPKSIIIGTKGVAVPLISEEHETAATCESLASMGPNEDSMEPQPSPHSSYLASECTPLHTNNEGSDPVLSSSACDGSFVLASSSLPNLGPFGVPTTSNSIPIVNLSSTPRPKKSQPSISPNVDVCVHGSSACHDVMYRAISYYYFQLCMHNRFVFIIQLDQKCLAFRLHLENRL